MIGIVTPYARCEATAAAIRIADVCNAYGEEPRLIAVGPCALPVHPYWDRRVWSTFEAQPTVWKPRLERAFYIGAQDCRLFVHLQSGPRAVARASLVEGIAPHYLVPCWHHLAIDDIRDLSNYDFVVSPTKALHDFIGTKCEPRNADSLTWTRFDAGLPFAKVERDGPLHVGFWVNGAAIDSGGFGILRCIETLLATHTTLRITTLYSRTWPENDRRCIRRLLTAFPGRFTAVRLDSFQVLTRLLHQLDWVVLPWPRSDFGIAVARSLACGVPVVTYDITPFNELIRHKHNGYLIGCELQLTAGTEAPAAIPNTSAMVELCQQLFADRKAWTEVRRHDWKVEQHTQTFNAAWAKILGYT